MLSQRRFYTVFAQQVQQRPGRAIGPVAAILGRRIGKPIVRMKAGNLQFAVPALLHEQRVGQVQEVVVVIEGLKVGAEHQNRCLDLLHRAGQQLAGRRVQIQQQSFVVVSHTVPECHPPLSIRLGRKRAQALADYHALKPLAHRSLRVLVLVHGAQPTPGTRPRPVQSYAARIH